MLKKLSLIALIALTSSATLHAKPDIKIYKDFRYHQDVTKLFMVKDLNMSQGAIDLYEHKETFETFGVINNKLEFVRIDFTDFEFQNKIEDLLKQGFRLKSIDYFNKFGSVKIENVGMLMKTIENDLDYGSLFDVKVEVILKFENILENVLVVMNYKTGVDKSSETCKICEELNGKNSEYFELIQIYFTKLEKNL